MPRARKFKVQGGALPSRSILHQLAKASYEERPEHVVDDGKEAWHLLHRTPTLAFYAPGDLNDHRIVIAVRGTNDFRDVRADVSIAFGRLEHSRRWKEDEREVRLFQASHPQSQWTYYGVGHSLGGAICDLLLKHGYITQAFSYNPALASAAHLAETPDQKHTRVYEKSDPLGRIGRAFGLQGAEIQDKGAETTLGAHRLSNFEGGALEADGDGATATPQELATELGNDDLLRALPGAAWLKYPDLANYSSIDAVLSLSRIRCVFILYLIESASEGHWTLLFERGDTIEFFDPLGLGCDNELAWVQADKRAELGETKPLLLTLLLAPTQRKHVLFNKYDFQKQAVRIQTCGRWCLVRAACREMDDDAFHSFILSQAKKMRCDWDSCVVELSRPLLK
jgi:hypothetical protein